VRPKDDDSDRPVDPGNDGVSFHGKQRSNATHQFVTDPDARMARKASNCVRPRIGEDAFGRSLLRVGVPRWEGSRPLPDVVDAPIASVTFCDGGCTMSSSTETLRSFSPEFQREAVRLMEERLGGESIAQISRELVVQPELLLAWWREQAASGSAGVTTEPVPSDTEEVRRLRRELSNAQQELGILTSAAAYVMRRAR
jgi:transposase-like protein